MEAIIDLDIYPIKTEDDATNIREAIEKQLDFPQVESSTLAFDEAKNEATLQFTVKSGFTTEISKTENKFSNMLKDDLETAINPYKKLTIDYHIETFTEPDIVNGNDKADLDEDYDY